MPAIVIVASTNDLKPVIDAHRRLMVLVHLRTEKQVSALSIRDSLGQSSLPLLLEGIAASTATRPERELALVDSMS